MKAGAHCPRAALERLYLPRSEGGRGLQEAKQIWEREVVGAVRYLQLSEDPQVKMAMRLQTELAGMGYRSIVKTALRVLKKYELHETADQDFALLPELAPGTLTKRLKGAQLQCKKQDLQTKSVHGGFARQCAKTETDKRGTHMWLTKGKLHPETEATIMALQDQVVMTRVHRSKVMKLGGDVMCRFCGERQETVAHILSGCGKLKWGLYKARHDRVLYQLAKVVGREMGLKVPKRLRKPGGLARSGVVGTSSKKMLVDVCIPTKRYISERRPDLVTIDKAAKRIVIYEVACAWDPGVTRREEQKLAKYQELAADLAKQCPGKRVKVVPVVFGALGSVTNIRKRLRTSQSLSQEAIMEIVREGQRETLCSAVRLVKRHMSLAD